MKNITIPFLVFCSWFITMHSQVNESSLDKIPMETVYVHTNTNLAFAGEYLYYQFYGILPVSRRLSTISKIGYVDLINEKKQIIFQHKLVLADGTGASEFFIPADLPSGNYKLIGYTNWMRNFPSDMLFKKDITILNPYLGDQKAILKNSTETVIGNISPNKSSNVNSYINPITISKSQTSYEKREKVVLTLASKVLKGLPGSYSMSVRKKEQLPSAPNKRLRDLTNFNPKKPNISNFNHLPETKGAFISGKIIGETSKTSSSQRLMISFPGENSVFKIATTDSIGIFRTQLSNSYNGEEVLIRPLNYEKNVTMVEMDSNRIIDYGYIDFYKFKLEEQMKDYILKRSVQNQIENAYFENKPDSILQPKPFKPFYGGPIDTYELDDYTRFSTFRETFVEILEHAWIDKDVNGNPLFKVRYFMPLQDSGERPLVFLDGAYIHDHAKLLTLSSKSIKTIKIGRDQYLYGPHSFQGIIDIYTFEGNTFENYLDDATKHFPYEQSRLKKNYYKENYSSEFSEAKKRLPDFRNQLLWLPEIKLKQDNYIIQFYTSDISGEFEIILEGITTLGVPISVTESFEVN